MKTKTWFIGFVIIAISLFYSSAYSQGVAINTSGASAHASAMFDVQSTTSGMLIPRMTATERGIILNPATGLLVFQTDAPAGFYFYNGSIWTRLSAGLDVNGTQNFVTKFTGSSSLGNSIIYDNGTNVGIGTDDPLLKLHVEGTSTETSFNILTGFLNHSTTKNAVAILGNCSDVLARGIGIYGQGGCIGVMGMSEEPEDGVEAPEGTENPQDPDNYRIGVCGRASSLGVIGPRQNYGVQGSASGPGLLNVGVYGVVDANNPLM